MTFKLGILAQYIIAPRPLDAKVRELTLLTLLACLGLGLAWAYEADYFAMVFAAEAAFAGFEAVRRSL
jgi:hypothetical protein